MNLFSHTLSHLDAVVIGLEKHDILGFQVAMNHIHLGRAQGLSKILTNQFATCTEISTQNTYRA